MPTQQTPDLEGFRAAQRRHVANMGHDATFHLPGAQTYPAGTALDPQTGEPYDPRIQPETNTGGDVVKKVNVIQRPAGGGLEGPTVAARNALMSAADVVLILLAEDHAAVQTATHVTVFGERYKITLFQPDGIGTVHRWLTYCEHA